MNYITSCPKCDTHFLISTEHLRAGQGKVQCGNCEHIFNAKNRLKPVAEDNFAEETPDWMPSRVPDLVIDKQVLEPQSIQVNEPVFLEDLSVASRKAPNQNLSSRIGLGLLCLLLGLAVGLQWIYFNRTRIAAQYPQYQPWLAAACEKLNCTIELPNNTELLVIDDLDMQEDQEYQDVINFSSTIINRANYAQAYPNIELTLTNTDDQVVLRKSIKPAEYLSTNVTTETGLAPHDEVHIKMPINTSNVAVSGYRVQLVY